MKLSNRGGEQEGLCLPVNGCKFRRATDQCIVLAVKLVARWPTELCIKHPRGSRENCIHSTSGNISINRHPHYATPSNHLNSLLNAQFLNQPLYLYVPQRLNTHVASVLVLNCIIYVRLRPVITPPNSFVTASSFHTFDAIPVCITFSKQDSGRVSSRSTVDFLELVINILFSLPSP